MHTSIITHLSTDSYRLKVFKLLLKSLNAQSNKDFELVIIVHDKEDKSNLVNNVLQEVNFCIESSIHYLPKIDGYQANAARNLGHSFAKYPYHLSIDADIVFPANFFDVISRKVNDIDPVEGIFDVYTFLHCGTLGWSNAKLGKEIGGQIGERYVTEKQLDEMNLEEKLAKAEKFVERLNKNTGLIHRSFEELLDIHKFVKQCTKDEITMYWRHPLAVISKKYRASEFYFLCHKNLFQTIGGWPIADKVKNRGCDKFVMVDILYYLHDRQNITIHTITDTYLMHIEHPRPYNMTNDSSAKKIRAEVQQHKFMKPIVSRMNELWSFLQNE